MAQREIPAWFKGTRSEYDLHCARQEMIYLELVRIERSPEYREECRRREASDRARARAAEPCACRVCR